MSFLSTEQQQEVANLFQNSGQEDNSTQGVENSQVQAQNEVSVSPTETATQNSKDDEGHAVPYSRFKSVIEARNEYKSKVGHLEKQLSDLQNQLSAVKATPQQETSQKRDFFDEFYGSVRDSYEEEPDAYTQKLQTIEKKLYQFEVDKAQMELQKEIATATQKYPMVPQEVLLNAVIENPDANIFSIAEQYNTFVSGLKEQAIAEYLSQGKQTTSSRSSLPPRVSSAGGSLVGKSVSGGQSPKTMDDARNALYEYLKANM